MASSLKFSQITRDLCTPFMSLIRMEIRLNEEAIITTKPLVALDRREKNLRGKDYPDD